MMGNFYFIEGYVIDSSVFFYINACYIKGHKQIGVGAEGGFKQGVMILGLGSMATSHKNKETAFIKTPKRRMAEE